MNDRARLQLRRQVVGSLAALAMVVPGGALLLGAPLASADTEQCSPFGVRPLLEVTVPGLPTVVPTTVLIDVVDPSATPTATTSPFATTSASPTVTLSPLPECADPSASPPAATATVTIAMSPPATELTMPPTTTTAPTVPDLPVAGPRNDPPKAVPAPPAPPRAEPAPPAPPAPPRNDPPAPPPSTGGTTGNSGLPPLIIDGPIEVPGAPLDVAGAPISDVPLALPVLAGGLPADVVPGGLAAPAARPGEAEATAPPAAVPSPGTAGGLAVPSSAPQQQPLPEASAVPDLASLPADTGSGISPVAFALPLGGAALLALLVMLALRGRTPRAAEAE